MLGIIMGTWTIALVTAIGWWVEQAVQDQFKTLSVNNLFVVPDGADSKIDTDDKSIVAESQYVTAVAWNTDSTFLVSNDNNTNIESYILQWVDENYFDIFNLSLGHGKYFADGDSVERVAVIGVDVVEDLFEYEDPRQALGEKMTIKSKKFTVIWVLDEIGVSFWPFSYDSTIYVPLWAAKRYLIKSNLTSGISAVIGDVENMEAAKQEITELLREEYNLKDDESDGFIMIDAGATIGIATEVAQILSFLLIGISIIILIVSGIGIMNVMFAWVAERTKEIWILKSIGASKKVIQSQFLMESIMITVISWLVWVFLAELIITLAIAYDAPITRSIGGDLLALWFACITGVLSWRYPAVRASNLDPVDALRS